MQDETRILIVDDNEADIWLLKDYLAQTNKIMSIEAIKDGKEALLYLKREGQYADADIPSLILLDLNIPKFNGKEILSELKKTIWLKEIPVIVLTTSSNPQDKEDCLKMGASLYLTKPASLDGYEQMIDTILGLLN